MTVWSCFDFFKTYFDGFAMMKNEDLKIGTMWEHSYRAKDGSRAW